MNIVIYTPFHFSGWIFRAGDISLKVLRVGYSYEGESGVICHGWVLDLRDNLIA